MIGESAGLLIPGAGAGLLIPGAGLLIPGVVTWGEVPVLSGLATVMALDTPVEGGAIPDPLPPGNTLAVVPLPTAGTVAAALFLESNASKIRAPGTIRLFIFSKACQQAKCPLAGKVRGHRHPGVFHRG